MYFLSINGTDGGISFIRDKTWRSLDTIFRNPTKQGDDCAD